MAARYVAKPPRTHLTVQDLEARWGVTRRTLYAWLNPPKEWLKGEQQGDGRWFVSKAEARRWEREHPRLRQLVEERRGGAA